MRFVCEKKEAESAKLTFTTGVSFMTKCPVGRRHVEQVVVVKPVLLVVVVYRS